MRESIERSGSLRPWIAPAVLLTLVALLASCGGAGRDPGPQDDIGETEPVGQVATGPRDAVTLEELTRRPERFYNERVTVNGKVGRLVSPNAFSLTGEDAAQSGDSFEVEAALVAAGSGSIPNLSEGQRVRVTGEVQPFEIKEVEQRLDANLDDSLYADFEEKPVVLPGAVEVLAGGETTGR